MNESSDSGPSSPSSRAPRGLQPFRCDISLQNPNRYPAVKTAELRPWLAEVLAELAPAAGSFAVRFCGDRAMRATNRDFRGIDKATDVLSFAGDLPPQGDPASFGKPSARPSARPSAPPAKAKAGKAALPVFAPPPGDHLGDLLISVPTAVRQAAELGHSADLELRVLLLHGILHCLGYDHEVDDGTMSRVEGELRRRFVGDIGFIEGPFPGPIEGLES